MLSLSDLSLSDRIQELAINNPNENLNNIKVLAKSYDKLNNYLIESHDNFKVLSEKYNKVCNCFNDANDNNIRLLDRLGKVETEFVKKTQTIVGLEMKIEDLNHNNETLTHENNTLKQDIELLKDQIKKLTQEIDNNENTEASKNKWFPTLYASK